MTRLLVLDTNILVSAGLSSGPPAQIVARVLRRELAAITCPSILREYFDVLHRPKFRKAGFPPGWLEDLLAVVARVPLDPAVEGLDLPDPKDAVFLALARDSGAVLVTGNLRDFPEEACGGVRVVSPHDYLQRLILLESGLG